MSTPPQLNDQGQTVELDLHGATVAEAARLIRSTLRVAHERGRRVVRVIHGRSTSDTAGSRRTIKNDFHRRLADGEWDHIVTGYQSRHDSTTLHLKLGNNLDQRTIRIDDLPW
jgi:hypothetical protein